MTGVPNGEGARDVVVGGNSVNRGEDATTGEVTLR